MGQLDDFLFLISSLLSPFRSVDDLAYLTISEHRLPGHSIQSSPPAAKDSSVPAPATITLSINLASGCFFCVASSDRDSCRASHAVRNSRAHLYLYCNPTPPPHPPPPTKFPYPPHCDVTELFQMEDRSTDIRKGKNYFFSCRLTLLSFLLFSSRLVFRAPRTDLPCDPETLLSPCTSHDENRRAEATTH